MSGRPGPKQNRRKEPRKRNDLGGRIDMPRTRELRGRGFNIEEEGPRIGWMRSEMEAQDDSGHRSQ